MASSNPVREMQEKRKRERRQAEELLGNLVKEKPTLKRPVFFVPGLTDERCANWVESYGRGYVSMKQWISRLVKNPELANFVTFTDQESEGCKSFFDFGDLLKWKIWKSIGRNKALDLVGHSMGGLDSVAAIVDESDPLEKVCNLITVATPHQGSELGDIGSSRFVQFLKKAPDHQVLQCRNLDPDRECIKLINKVELRRRLLKSVQKLVYFEGTRDMAVMRGARFNTASLAQELCAQKVMSISIGGARHSQGEGITQDPRVVHRILCQLLDVPVEVKKGNRGYIYRKS